LTTIIFLGIIVSFDSTEYSVREGDGQIFLPVMLGSSPSIGDITMDITTFDGSAIG